MKLSVLMPCYNSSRYLKSAIKSILSQTFSNFQFIIIDDGSTDSTEEIISLFKDERILYKKKEHTGLSDTLNYGLKCAQTELVARMDADDISHPDRFKIQTDFLINNPQFQIISSWYAIFRNKKIDYLVTPNIEDSQIKKSLSLYSPLSHPGICLRKASMLNENYNQTFIEDYELWLRLLKKINFHIIPKILVYQRFRQDSLSRSNISLNYEIHYKIQDPYYTSDFRNYFKIYDEIEELKIRGWREYFYGNRKKAFNYWIKIKWNIFKDYKIPIALIVMFLPKKIFIKFKELRARYKIEYYLNYYSKTNKLVRSDFNNIIKNLVE